MDAYGKIPLNEKPKHLYVYYVTGRGSFPLDMLRYDAAWPGSTETADEMSRDKGWKCIKLHSYREPTVARWSSFGWRVTKDHVGDNVKV